MCDKLSVASVALLCLSALGLKALTPRLDKHLTPETVCFAQLPHNRGHLKATHQGYLMTITSGLHTPSSSDTASSDPRKDSLIEYPSLFPIKVMGLKVDALLPAVTALARQFDPFFDAATVELRESSGGKYLGITITITATSREQLDGLYLALTAHPLVKVVL